MQHCINDRLWFQENNLVPLTKQLFYVREALRLEVKEKSEEYIFAFGKVNESGIYSCSSAFAWSGAAALPDGNLIVPVIKKAQEKNILGLTTAVNDLAKRARENQLTPDEVNGGTFTVTNVGSFGSIMGTPIINQPQVAILALGKIQKKATVIETEFGDTIGIRSKMFLSLSYDHRVIDGALGSQFLQRIAHYLESFDTSKEIWK